MSDPVEGATEFANRWPIVALLTVVIGGAGWLLYDQTDRADRRESELLAASKEREKALLTQVQNMISLMERCVVVPPESIPKQ
jgi:hypothetical protein